MCNFISWIEHDSTKKVYYINDEVLERHYDKIERAQGILPSGDVLGHGLIKALYKGIDDWDYTDHEQSHLGEVTVKNELPPEIVADIKRCRFRKVFAAAGEVPHGAVRMLNVEGRTLYRTKLRALDKKLPQWGDDVYDPRYCAADSQNFWSVFRFKKYRKKMWR